MEKNPITAQVFLCIAGIKNVANQRTWFYQNYLLPQLERKQIKYCTVVIQIATIENVRMRQEEMLLLKEYHHGLREKWFFGVRPRFKYQIFSICDFKKVTWLLWNLAFFICKVEKNNTYSWQYWWLNKIIFIKLLITYRPSINASAVFLAEKWRNWFL